MKKATRSVTGSFRSHGLVNGKKPEGEVMLVRKYLQLC